MANDPAFLFYPGDYLRDTQCLSEQSQVAYDRIMCEHMRNICISETRLNFFTKRLSAEQKEEVANVLTKTDDGYQITWVSESISKRRTYSDSRRKNRIGIKKDMNDICKSYDSHMDNENENEIVNENKNKKEYNKKFRFKESLIQYGFSEKLVNDWMAVRKTKHATNTETAFNKFITEIKKRPCDINEVLLVIVEKSWSGFNWDWMEAKGAGKESRKSQIIESVIPATNNLMNKYENE